MTKSIYSIIQLHFLETYQIMMVNITPMCWVSRWH